MPPPFHSLQQVLLPHAPTPPRRSTRRSNTPATRHLLQNPWILLFLPCTRLPTMPTFHLLPSHLPSSRPALSWPTSYTNSLVHVHPQPPLSSRVLLPQPNPIPLLPRTVGRYFDLRLSQTSLRLWIASRALSDLHAYLAYGTIAHPTSGFEKRPPPSWTQALTSASPVTSSFWLTSSKSHHFLSQWLSPVTLPPSMTAALVGATSHCNSRMALRIGSYASIARTQSKQSYPPRPFWNPAKSLLHGHRRVSRTVAPARFVSTATMDSSPCA